MYFLVCVDHFGSLYIPVRWIVFVFLDFLLSGEVDFVQMICHQLKTSCQYLNICYRISLSLSLFLPLNLMKSLMKTFCFAKMEKCRCTLQEILILTHLLQGLLLKSYFSHTKWRYLHCTEWSHSEKSDLKTELNDLLRWTFLQCSCDQLGGWRIKKDDVLLFWEPLASAAHDEHAAETGRQ